MPGAHGIFAPNTPERTYQEVIPDDSESVICVIDNSKSMETQDGKIIKKVNGRWKKIGSKGMFGTKVTRWREAVHGVNQVAEYNFNRGVLATYYLLNPTTPGTWIAGGAKPDYVVIDPSKENSIEEVRRKLQPILSDSRVGGLTPLSTVTRHLTRTLRPGSRVCYVVFTDGTPNNDNKRFDWSKREFEASIRELANATGRLASLQKLFVTINLCTDEDDVVQYYNQLDENLKSELSGMDVLDDLESEAAEVQNAGNGFITYCNEIHVCRMAGCHNLKADALDENKLSPYHAAQLVKEILKLDVSDQPCRCGARNKISDEFCRSCGEKNEMYEPEYDDNEAFESRSRYKQRLRAKNTKVFDPLTLGSYFGSSERYLVNEAALGKILWPDRIPMIYKFVFVVIAIAILMKVYVKFVDNYYNS
jgi:ribosomal protein L40E